MKSIELLLVSKRYLLGILATVIFTFNTYFLLLLRKCVAYYTHGQVTVYFLIFNSFRRLPFSGTQLVYIIISVAEFIIFWIIVLIAVT